MFKFLENYFTFTTWEKRGIIILISLTVIVLLAGEVYPYFKPVEHTDKSKYDAEIKAFNDSYSADNPVTNTPVAKNSVQPVTMQAPTITKHKEKRGTEFEFDPNTITATQWMELGFSEKQAEVIDHYRQAGGKFHKPEDIKKLYVMSEENYERLLPYVRIVKQKRTRKNAEQ